MKQSRMVLGLVVCAGVAAGAREVPVPADDHPGNVFHAGEAVAVLLPDGVAKWKAVDDRDQAIGEGSAEGETADLGTRGIGWYRIDFFDADGKTTGWTTCAVLARLAEPVPEDSPICIDSATAWFAGDDAPKQQRFAQLAALAGVNWIRDRMTWGELEPKPGEFANESKYDTSAAAHADAGLMGLQVFHSTPNWAVDTALDGEHARQRFPRDLRHLHRFCRAMAERYRGRVAAWEPWNEANITHFGGHTIDEMCTLQKAAYLGFKASDPDLLVCWNVFAGPGTQLHTEGVLANETWPYFEIYNIHTYSAPKTYTKEFETAREGASGRPIWLSECGIRLRFEEGDPHGELSREHELRQAEFIAQSYSNSLFAGVDRHFFFILGNYLERGIQFGLLRHDQTPRPGYVALAAVGRLLAGARCLGRMRAEGDAAVYVFRARPDAESRDVVVAWGDTPMPRGVAAMRPVAVFDYLGRSLSVLPKQLTTAPTYIVVPEAACEDLPLEPPPPVTARRDGTPSPVVLQAQMPHEAVRLAKQAYEIESASPVDVPLFVYNFGAQEAKGFLAVEEAPKDWEVKLDDALIVLAVDDRAQVRLRVQVPARGEATIRGGTIRLRGDFGSAGRPVLAFCLVIGAPV